MDADLAAHHLAIAYDELKHDSTLPKYSIYRILIPRRLSDHIYNDARALVWNNGGMRAPDLFWRTHIAAEARDYLIQAGRLACESFDAQKNLRDSERTGDLLFGYSHGESSADAELVAKVASLYNSLFWSGNGPPHEGMGPLPESIPFATYKEAVKLIHKYETDETNADAEQLKRVQNYDELLVRLQRLRHSARFRSATGGFNG
jgi:hypothetical protein